LVCEAPNNWRLVSHYYERLYTLGVDVDRKRWMNRGGKEDNGHR